MSTKPVGLLIVDDDPVFALFVRQVVTALGSDFPCSPHCVDTPEKALAELAAGNYDLVLLDYHLPGADGLEVLSRIRQLPAEHQPAVIMLTGSGNETVAVEAMKLGARDYLLKDGLESAPLLRSLSSALRQKQLADQVARHDARMRADLEMARHFQQSLLPDSYPSFPRAGSNDSALRFFHRFLPASELAGDFFNVLRVSDTQAGVFICDVMGHGVRSALVTAIVHALVDHAAPRAADPGKFLARVNQRLAGLLKPAEGPLFATAFYLTVDIESGRAQYACAGHPAPLHLRRERGLVAPLPIPTRAGPALGIFRSATYATSELTLEDGDIILLFTDGLFEVTADDGVEEYGRERLLAAAKKHLHLGSADLCDALIADVREFAGSGELADDVCLLGVEAVHVSRKNTPTNPVARDLPNSESNTGNP